MPASGGSGVSIRVLGSLRPVGEDQCEPRKKQWLSRMGREREGAHGSARFRGAYTPSARLKGSAPLPAIRMTQEARSAFRYPRFFFS